MQSWGYTCYLSYAQEAATTATQTHVGTATAQYLKYQV